MPKLNSSKAVCSSHSLIYFYRSPIKHLSKASHAAALTNIDQLIAKERP